jgi:hypothetical protein
MDGSKKEVKQTFADLHRLHIFDLSRLAMHAGVHPTIPDKMIRYESVLESDAMRVLQMASHISNNQYTLRNVDVNVVKAEYNDE